MRRSLSAVLLILVACTNVPELGERVRPDLTGADYPRLVPVESLLGRSNPPAEDAEALAEGLNGRIARLRARAAALQRPVVDSSARQRMAEGVTEPG